MKIKIRIEYPWCGVPDDVETIDIENGLDLETIENIVAETAGDMVWERVSYSWEVEE